MKSVNDIIKATGLSKQRINILIQQGRIKATLFENKIYIIDDREYEKFLKSRIEKM
jgi:hypothetical protein